MLFPLLAPFGIADLRGALFNDLGHAWNFGYNDVERVNTLNTGVTFGAVGGGLRINMFGVLVLRYDLGFKHRNLYQDWDSNLFHQFFFGYNF